MANQSLITTSANILVVLLNNVPVGLIQNITSTDDYNPEPASGVGDIHAIEYVPTFARYTVAVDRMLMRKSSLMTVANGIADNGAESQSTTSPGLWSNGYQVMQGYVFDIIAMGGGYQIPTNRLSTPDPATGTSAGGNILRKWYNCSFANGQLTIQKNQIVIERATFFCTQVDGLFTLN